MKLEWDTPLYQQALTQLDHALELAEVPDFVAKRLRGPERAVILTLPVRMDDDTYSIVPRLPRPALIGARADQGRHPLRPGASTWASALRSRCG